MRAKSFSLKDIFVNIVIKNIQITLEFQCRQKKNYLLPILFVYTIRNAKM